MRDAEAFSRLVDRLGAAEALMLLDAQQGIGASIPTVTELCARHLAGLDGITDGTRLDYERMVARRIETQPIGALPVTVVTVELVRTWLAYLEHEGLSTKTRRNHHALLSAAFQTAIREQLLGRNPAKGITLKKSEADAGRVFLTAGEFAVLLAAIDSHFVPFVAWLAGTGMRWGEVTALLVGDVDLDAPTPVAYVRRAWKRTGKGGHDAAPRAPKTRAGLRTVPLAPEVVAVVRHLVDERPADAYVFTAKGGGPVRNDHFHARVWKPALDRLNARVDENGNPKTPALTKRPNVHSLRHTFASAQIAAGVNLLDLKVHLGHESITTTVDTYGHLQTGALATGAAASSLFLRQALPEVLEIEG
jgi:integrase